MRIDAVNQVSQLYQKNGTKKYGNVNRADSKDKLEISQLGKDYQIARQAAASAADIREEKVSAIKQAMANGTYGVSDDELADKLLESFDLPF